MTSSAPKTNKQPASTGPVDQQAQHKFSPTRYPPVFTEGVSQLAVGFPISRLVFDSHPAQISPDGKEVTHFVAAEIVIPTNSLADLAKQIIEALLQSKDQLGDAGTDWNKELISLITKLQEPSK